jgi:hypothetical protein
VRKVILDTCTLDIHDCRYPRCVEQRDQSRVALTAENVGNLHLGPLADNVRADDNLSLQARDVIKLRLNTGSAWNECGFSSRRCSTGGFDIIQKICLVRAYEQEALIRMDGGRTGFYV